MTSFFLKKISVEVIKHTIASLFLNGHDWNDALLNPNSSQYRETAAYVTKQVIKSF